MTGERVGLQDASDAGARSPRGARARDVGVPLAIVAGCALANVVLLRRWRGDLPEPLATHFDGSGLPNGFMSWQANLITTLAMTVAFPVLMLIVFAIVPGGQLRRSGAALASGLAVFLTFLSLTSVADQRGLADAHATRMSGVGLGLGVAAGVIAAGLAFWIAPASPGGPRPTAAELPRMPLRGRERAVWTSRDSSPVVLVVAVLLGCAGVLVQVILRDLFGAGLLLGIGALAAGLSRVRARVDEHGLSWRMGILHRRIPLSRITSARAVEVDPMEYGGWGYRLSGNGQAIVTRSGPGLRITRDGASDLTITVPDAQTGAALLNTLIERSGAGVSR